MAMFLLHCAEIQLFRELCVSLRKQKLTVSSRNVLNFELFMRNEMFAFCCCWKWNFTRRLILQRSLFIRAVFITQVFFARIAMFSFSFFYSRIVELYIACFMREANATSQNQSANATGQNQSTRESFRIGRRDLDRRLVIFALFDNGVVVHSAGACSTNCHCQRTQLPRWFFPMSFADALSVIKPNQHGNNRSTSLVDVAIVTLSNSATAHWWFRASN